MNKFTTYIRRMIAAVAIASVAMLTLGAISAPTAQAAPVKNPIHSVAHVMVYWMGTVKWSWENSDGVQKRQQEIAGSIPVAGVVVDDHGTIITSNLAFSKKHWGVIPAIDAEWANQYHTPEGETPWTDEMVAGHTVTNIHLVGIAVTTSQYPNGLPSEYKLVHAEKLGDEGNFAVIAPKQRVKTAYSAVSDAPVPAKGDLYYVTERNEGGEKSYKLGEPWPQAGHDKYQFKLVTKAKSDLVGSFVIGKDGTVVGMVNGQHDDVGMNYIIANGRMASYAAKHGIKVKHVSTPAPEPTQTASPAAPASPTPSATASQSAPSQTPVVPSATPEAPASEGPSPWLGLGLAVVALATGLAVVAFMKRRGKRGPSDPNED